MTAAFTVVDADARCSGWLRPSGAMKVVRGSGTGTAVEGDNVFVLASASRLDDVADIVRDAGQRRHLRGLLVHDDVADGWVQILLHRAGIRARANVLVHRDDDQPRRILGAWRLGCPHQLIATAIALDDRLVALDCALDRVEVPWESVPALERMTDVERRAFEIAADGSHIHWPAGDVHVDIDTLRTAAHPETARRSHEVLAAHDLALGRAVAALRAERGLRQADIGGVSARQVRRIERGEVRPRTTTLQRLAEAHGLSLDAYLDMIAARLRYPTAGPR